MKSPRKKTARFLRYALKADVEQVTQAPQQQQPRLSTASVREPEHDAAQSTQQRTAEQVVNVPDDVELQQTAPVQQRIVEQAVGASNLDQEPLNVTQRVQAKAAPEGSISRAVRLELERVWFEKEARRRYFRARCRFLHIRRTKLCRRQLVLTMHSALRSSLEFLLSMRVMEVPVLHTSVRTCNACP